MQSRPTPHSARTMRSSEPNRCASREGIAVGSDATLIGASKDTERITAVIPQRVLAQQSYVLLVPGPSQGLVEPAVRVGVYRHVVR